MNQVEYKRLVREHLSNVFLNDQLIELAHRSAIPYEQYVGVLQPLVTEAINPGALVLLQVAFTQPRKGIDFLRALYEALAVLDDWTSDEIQRVATWVGQEHQLSRAGVEQICKHWMLFGPSPLNTFTSMQVFGRKRTLERCRVVIESFTAANNVG